MTAMGNLAENLAVCFCRKKQWVVLARQHRIAKVQIDIVALDSAKQIVYFIEVKKKKRNRYEEGFPAVSLRQKRRYARAVEAFLASSKSEVIALVVLVFDNLSLEVVPMFP